ncbi:hypothetical protein EIP86_011432 [Pleurotus ostreatoroseus]|nr:hypothetical protein EIP86_011432 [Pleurotus ostreatoroseus]
MNFENFKAGKESYKLRFFVGHDGTMIRVASALGFGKLAPLRWPALGSEIVMEVWESKGQHFVRVMWEGTPVSSLEWVTLDNFIGLLNSQIPTDLFATCNSYFAALLLTGIWALHRQQPTSGPIPAALIRYPKGNRVKPFFFSDLSTSD